MSAPIYSDKLISVIMPVYNCGTFLKYALDSILTQTYRNLEILIIYDESFDNTYDIVSNFILLDSRIKIIHGNSSGLINALNLGLKNANGCYIARMDADDVSLPQRIESQFLLLQSSGCDICGSHFEMIDNDGVVGNKVYVPTSHEQIAVELCRKVPFAHGSVLIRKSFLNKNNLTYGGNQFGACEDYDLWVRMFNLGAKFCNSDLVLYQYRDQPYSISKNKSLDLYFLNTRLSRTFYSANRNLVFGYLLNVSNDRIVTSIQKSFSYVLVQMIFDCKLSAFLLLVTKYRPSLILWGFAKYFYENARYSFLAVYLKIFRSN